MRGNRAKASRLDLLQVSKKVLRMLVADVSNDGDDSVDMEEWVRLVNNIYRGMNDWQVRARARVFSFSTIPAYLFCSCFDLC
jgi:hypothetical protein